MPYLKTRQKLITLAVAGVCAGGALPAFAQTVAPTVTQTAAPTQGPVDVAGEAPVVQSVVVTGLRMISSQVSHFGNVPTCCPP